MTTAATDSQPMARIVGNIGPKSILIIVFGRPGVAWGKGAHLGEEIGVVVTGHYYTASIYDCPWASGYVIAAEVLTLVPESFREAFAQAIIDKIQPSKVALLDQYVESKYQPPAANPPIRYIQGSGPGFNPVGILSQALGALIPLSQGTHAEPFAPPNKINNTSTVCLSAWSSNTTSIMLYLLPAPKTDEADPVTVQPGSSHAMEDTYTWDKDVMQEADNLLLDAVGAKRRVWG